jgi:hypothetical protein
MMNVKFHGKSLELIGHQPEFGLMTYPDLPASVAEWFSLVDGVELLKNTAMKMYPSRLQSLRPSNTMAKSFSSLWLKIRELYGGLMKKVLMTIHQTT